MFANISQSDFIMQILSANQVEQHFLKHALFYRPRSNLIFFYYFAGYTKGRDGYPIYNIV